MLPAIISPASNAGVLLRPIPGAVEGSPCSLGGSVGLSMYNHGFPGFPCPASWRLQPRPGLSRGGLAGTIPTSPAAPWARGPECPLRGWAPAIPSHPAGLRALAVEQRCPSPRLPHGLSPRRCCSRLLSRTHHTTCAAPGPCSLLLPRCWGGPALCGCFRRLEGGAPFQPCPPRLGRAKQ